MNLKSSPLTSAAAGSPPLPAAGTAIGRRGASPAARRAPAPRPAASMAGPLAPALALALAFALASAPAPAGAQTLSEPGGEPFDSTSPISISADHMTADDSRRLVTFTGRVVARQADLIISCDVMRVNYQPHGSYGAPSGAAGDQAAPSAGQDPQVPALPPPAEPPGSDAGAAVPPGAPSAADLGAAGSAPGPEAEPSAAAETGGPSAEPAATGDSQDSGRRSPLQGGQEIDKVECEGAVKIQQGDRMAVAKRALYLAKAQPRRLVLTGEARVWQGPNSITGHQITYYLDENRSLVDSQGSRRVRAFYDQRGTPR